MTPRIRRRRSFGLVAPMAAALLVLGCAADVPVSPAGDPSLTPGELSAAQVEDLYRRRVTPVRNLTIEATLWDPNLIAMDVDTSGDVDSSDAGAQRQARTQAWRERYVEGSTSFYVVLELANRPPVEEEGQDPLVNPRNWGFELDRGEQEALLPETIQVISQDRFPTQGGGHHWRLVYFVQFEGALYDAARGGATGNGVEVVLRVRPEADFGRRNPYGRRLSRTGFRLKWWATPAS